jgi:hypothetical protein
MDAKEKIKKPSKEHFEGTGVANAKQKWQKGIEGWLTPFFHLPKG